MVVGLTGGIGSGKTTVAKMFHKLGVPIYIADIEAKKLMYSSVKLKQALIAVFGEKIYTDEGELNRSYLSKLVFKNPKQLQKLNNIVHPAVGKHFIDWVSNHKDHTYIIKEAAILFESGSYTSCDKIIMVTAPLEERFKRVMKRDNTTKEAVQNRMNNQWNDEKKIELSDYIVNNIDLEDTEKQVLEIHQQILKLAD